MNFAIGESGDVGSSSSIRVAPARSTATLTRSVGTSSTDSRPEPEAVDVARDRVVQRRHRDADVMQFLDHLPGM